MEHKLKITKTNAEVLGRIHKKYALPENCLRFSFKYLDLNNKFHIDDVGKGYLLTFVERLKSISGMSVSDFRSNRNKSLRAHMHDWSKTTEKAGYTCLNSQLKGCEPWQFQLTANEHGRVHGILLDEVFYVVWLDPKHKLYE